MNTNVILEACANMASISERFERHAKGALKIIDHLRNDKLGEEYDTYLDDMEPKKEEHNCGNCMNCLGLSWRDFI